jgi:hypothetical protein
LTQDGVKDASLDLSQIQKWGKKYPNANIGIVTGAVSGVLALDVDPRHSGDEELDKIRAQYGKIPNDVMAVTGSGGAHYLFKYPGKDGRSTTGLWPGIHTRGDDDYIVVEPSNHISGGSYFWDAEACPFEGAVPPVVPDWLREKLAEKKGVQAEKKSSITKLLTPIEIKNIRAALRCIPADVRFWNEVGRALIDTGARDQAFEFWVEWASQSNEFNPQNRRRDWDSFSYDEGITRANLFEIAKQYGYVPELARRLSENTNEKLSIPNSFLSNFHGATVNCPIIA